MIDCLAHAAGRDWTLYHGDCIEVLRQMPPRCVDIAVYSPPFANLYVYSDTPRDVGNCADDGEFLEQYRYVVAELYRLTRPGRIVVVHCADLPSFAYKHGVIGRRDLPGDIIRAHQDAGFIYHSRVTIWKDPVTEMQRTKSIGLLYKQLRKDSCMSRQGIPDYLVIFRREPNGPEEETAVEAVEHTEISFPLPQWQEWASAVWMTIDQGNTLNVGAARGANDERHLCPLQLDVIERAVTLWSNPGDVVLSPFAGVGSEGVGALRLGRKFVGVELKKSYFERAAINLRQEEGAEQVQLFAASP